MNLKMTVGTCGLSEVCFCRKSSEAMIFFVSKFCTLVMERRVHTDGGHSHMASRVNRLSDKKGNFRFRNLVRT